MTASVPNSLAHRMSLDNYLAESIREHTKALPLQWFHLNSKVTLVACVAKDQAIASDFWLRQYPETSVTRVEGVVLIIRWKCCRKITMEEEKALAIVNDPNRMESKQYWCQLCFGWHLSSQGVFQESGQEVEKPKAALIRRVLRKFDKRFVHTKDRRELVLQVMRDIGEANPNMVPTRSEAMQGWEITEKRQGPEGPWLTVWKIPSIGELLLFREWVQRWHAVDKEDEESEPG